MNKHENILKTINPNLEIIERFAGGMSNFTYLVKNPISNKQFTFRVPGKGAQNFVDFEIERTNLAIIDELDLNSHAIYTDPNTGYKISTYIPGNIVDETIDFNLVAETLKKLHTSKLKLANDYDHLTRLNKYEQLHTRDEQKYRDLKEEFILIYEKYLKIHLAYPCHNDAQVANMIFGDDQKLHLLDWEFAGTNDFIYDIASFGNKSFDMAENLMNYYFDEPTNDHYIRLYSWRMFQCLQWYNVASYKDEIGLSQDLNVDFASVCANYLNLAELMFGNINKHLK